MSKRAAKVPAVIAYGLGDLLGEIGNPEYQAALQLPTNNEDWREFLEAARKLFAYKTDEHARELLKMPIDSPAATQKLAKALVGEIDEIKQEADVAHDPMQRCRLQLALLIEDGLTKIRSKWLLKKWTVKILKKADEVTSAKRSQDGATREVGPDITKQRWAASHIERLRHKKPDISVTKIAAALYATARKEKPGCWPNAESLRVWLYRNNLLQKKAKTAR